MSLTSMALSVVEGGESKFGAGCFEQREQYVQGRVEAKREHKEEDDEPFLKQEGRVGVLGVDQGWGMSGPGPH